MKTMRWIGLVAAALTLAAAEGGAPRTAAEVKNVLVLQMGAGLDQYVASQLTRKGVVTVVQDPAKADAVFTDRIGPALRERLEEWREQMSPAPAGRQEEDTGWRKPSFAGISRGKGNYYLVDIHTYDVIWSFYHVPKSNQSGDLDRAAGRIASAFEEARKGKK